MATEEDDSGLSTPVSKGCKSELRSVWSFSLQCSSQSEEVVSFSDESADEGESEWDVLGRSAPSPHDQSPCHGSQTLVCCRMNSVRRSSLFDRPHFTKVTLTRTPAGYGLELQGSGPAVVSCVCK